MSYANNMVDRRAFTRDRCLFGDRRSIILPNLSDESRRITVIDRRSRFGDRRMQQRIYGKVIKLKQIGHRHEVRAHVPGTFRW